MLLDILIIAVFIICVAVNIKKGFVKGILGVAVFAAAAFIAIYASDAFLDYAKTTQTGIAAKSKIYNVTYERLYEAGDGENAIDALNLPPFIKESVLKNADELTGSANDKISDAVSEGVFALLCRIILFLAVSVILAAAKKIILQIVKLPVLRQADKALGAAAGVICALFYCCIIMLTVYALQSFWDNDFLYKVVLESKIYALIFLR